MGHSGHRITFFGSLMQVFHTYAFQVFVNSGGALNQQMGVFTAPLDGVYYFAFTVGKYPEKKLSVALMKNNLESQVRYFMIVK